MPPHFKNFPIGVQNSAHIRGCPAYSSLYAGLVPADEFLTYGGMNSMEETTVVYGTGSQQPSPAPLDLDDLIFQGEYWFASDR